MAWSSESRVNVEDGIDCIACKLDDLTVGGKICYFQIHRQTALQCTLEISGPAGFQIGFGNHKTVGGGGHKLQTFARLARYFAFRHEYAETLVGTAPHTSTQLM